MLPPPTTAAASNPHTNSSTDCRQRARMGKKWVPLESNPEVMTEYISKIGCDTSDYVFHDVFGLEEDLLAMVPQPVKALIMCYPITDDTEAAAKKEDEKLAQSSQPSDLFYLKQTIGNACGTIAIIHSICNNTKDLTLAPGSFLSDFMSATKDMDASARGHFLEDPPQGGPDIEAAHQAAASVGDTAPPSENEEVNLHFVAYIHKDGTLWELDGRRRGPVPHGPTSPDTLLQDSAAVIKEFIETSNSLNFSLVALAAQG